MDNNFKGNIQHTWKRFLILLLGALGSAEEDIEAARKKYRIKPEHMRAAQSAVAEMARAGSQLMKTACKEGAQPKTRSSPKEAAAPANEPSSKRRKTEHPGPAPPQSSSSASSASPPRRGDPHGYYAALGIQPGASLEQIRSGYYSRALATHPDKGGSDELFRQVREAFDFLADSEQRAAYGGNQTQSTGNNGFDTSNLEDSKYACAMLVTAASCSWPGMLATMKNSVLSRLHDMLQQSQIRNSLKVSPDALECRSAHDEASCDAPSGDVSGSKDKGITRRCKKGYCVKVSWRTFSVETFAPIPDLKDALKIHIWLMQLKDVASERHCGFKKDLLKFGCTDTEGRDDDCPPLLQEELFQFLCELPLVQLRFASDLRRPKSSKPGPKTRENRIESPYTPSLASAHHFRLCSRRVLAQNYEAVAGPDHVTIIKKMMEERAVQDRQNRQALESNLMKAVSSEIDRRKQATSERPASAPALSAPQVPNLALEDGEASTVQAMQLAQAALAENARLHEDARRAAAAESLRKQELEELKQEMLRNQAAAATKEVELKAAAAAEKAELKAAALVKESELKVAAFTKEAELQAAVAAKEVELKAASKDVELKTVLVLKADAEQRATCVEYEQELLKQQQTINKLEHKSAALLAAAAQGGARVRATAGISNASQDAHMRMMQESANAAKRESSMKQGDARSVLQARMHQCSAAMRRAYAPSSMKN